MRLTLEILITENAQITRHAFVIGEGTLQEIKEKISNEAALQFSWPHDPLAEQIFDNSIKVWTHLSFSNDEERKAAAESPVKKKE